jgi:serine protease Do
MLKNALLLSTILFSCLGAKAKEQVIAANTEMTAPGFLYAKELSKTFTQVADKAIPAVVFIQADVQVDSDESFHSDPFADDFFNRFFGAQPKQKQLPYNQPLVQRAQGSGFLFTDDGYILTNLHVVKNATKIVVDLNDDKHSSYTAEFIGGDPQTDVAVIKIQDANRTFPHLEFQDAKKIDVGEWVVAVGNPFNLHASVTVGVISAKGRSNLEILDLEDYLQTDAAIYPGNSGGPLLDLDGKVVGMNTAILTQRGNFLGIGFAIPSNIASSIASQIMEKGKVTRGFIGVYLQDVDAKMAEALNLDRPYGAIVTSVTDDSPAAKAGLKQGDVILEVNGTLVKDRDSVRKTIQLLPAGSVVSFKINRMGKVMSVKVAVGYDQKEAAQMGAVAQKLGLFVETLSPELAAKYGYKSDETGAIVTDVKKGSVASLGKIKPGMLIKNINHQPITSAEDFNAALDKTGGRNVFMFVTDANSKGMFVTLSIAQ